MNGEASVRPSTTLLLRDVAEDDLPVFFNHQSDPAANHMAAFPARNRAAFMAHWTRILDDDSVIARTIVVDGEVVGNIVSFVQTGEREVGYWIGKHYWGQGIATGALAALLGQETERPLYAHVATHNIGSLRVLQKSGFVMVSKGAETPHSKGDDVEWFRLELPAWDREGRASARCHRAHVAAHQPYPPDFRRLAPIDREAGQGWYVIVGHAWTMLDACVSGQTAG